MRTTMHFHPSFSILLHMQVGNGSFTMEKMYFRKKARSSKKVKLQA
jgi:hypothetical protein